MKKTLCTVLLCLGVASTASALSLSDAVKSGAPTQDSYTLSEISAGSANDFGFTLTLELNATNLLSALQNQSDATLIASIGKGSDKIFTAEAVAESATKAGIYRGNTNTHVSTSGTVPAATRWSGTAITGYDLVLGSTSLRSLTADDITEAALTMTYNYSANSTIGSLAGTTFVLTLKDAEGNFSSYASQWSGLRWSDLTSLDTVAFNRDLVNSYYLFDSAVSVNDAITLNSNAIPEPATATLSLLALAGLAARRRRK